MRTPFLRCALIFSIVLPSAAFAARKSGGLSLGLEPIIGYERVQKLVPTEHTNDRLVYGARLTLGFPLLSLEGEYTQSKDTETFTDQGLVVKDSAQKLKVGLRSTVSLTMALKAFARGGMQATRNEHTEETNGVQTAYSKEPERWDPYAGAGFKVAIGRKLSLTGDVVAVFKQWPNMKKNEYLTSVGFEIKVP